MAQDMTHYPVYINGEWLDASKRERFEVQNPANNETYATVTACTADDVQYALETSEKAQFAWHLTPAQTRANYIFALCDKLKEQKEHFATLLVKEQGKTYAEALAEVDDTVRYMQYAAEAGRRIQGAIFPSENPNERLEIHKVPFGVTVALCAYNYPLALIGRKLGPALVTGNTVILKPHELTPTTCSEFCKLVEAVGIPNGVVNMVATTNAQAASLLVESPITRLISLTGSTNAGRAMYRAAANNITGLILELGGKAPFIVLEDADIDKAVEAAAISRYANCGQVCICNEMVFVDGKIADEFTEKLIKRVQQIKVGNPFDSSVNMGPNVSAPGLDRVDGLVKQDIANGAELVMGGGRPEGAAFEKGNWYAPTILTNVKHDGATTSQELFAPVLPIVKIDGFDEALAINNSREEALSAYLFTNDYKIHQKAIDQLQIGTIFINKQITGYIQGYHSGHKTAGLGGEDGVYGIDQHLQRKTIYLDY
ncbi:aldehyde dehydrogenase family protein [Tamlana sp. 2_MG-2023]|uniref:aldehyde dehydrogenase family protein n=1 Tax=unclassified Tamlana TaxID=2614803 RepID=UPI0026E35816|nr:MULTISPECIES: aldehyde dehydrogenase family protein [unclassified Tamlana]MDO6761319.1 aldehyde dehydrogenase family protein [Tamlana sp. 2_MG-2023]MDO6791802.1 aldehyde dehydrogenase family protein [Tamlana sp. 1_MG-2023]